MKEPIKAGDTCEVVGGLGRDKSPNLGLRVMAVATMGEHSQLGRVWRCTGDGVKQYSETGGFIDTGWADFPVAWLRKIEPPQAPTVGTTTERDITA